MTKRTVVKQEFEPVVVAMCCNWCSYTGADLAGISRCQYPTNVRIVRVMCSGMVAPSLVIEALTKGADGVVVCGCHLGDCHYQDGNVRAQSRAEAITLMLQDFGIDEDRFKLAWVSAAEGPQFAKLMADFTEQVRRLGPSPHKKAVETVAEVI